MDGPQLLPGVYTWKTFQKVFSYSIKTAVLYVFTLLHI